MTSAPDVISPAASKTRRGWAYREWACEELNLGPHAYQSRDRTHPIGAKSREFMAGPGNLPYRRGSNTAKCRNQLRKYLRNLNGPFGCTVRLPREPLALSSARLH